MKTENVNFSKPLQNDNVLIHSEVKNLYQVTGLNCRRGLEKIIVSEGQIVNVVSDSYGHLPNELFFAKVEEALNKADIHYITRSINRDNRSFAVDYILSDERFIVKVKNGLDKIRPMLRFVNSYDGSCKTSGSFGYFREVCTNGLHVSESNIGFSVKHRGEICEFVMPEIRLLAQKFIDNEFYTLSRKFEVLAEQAVRDLQGFVKLAVDKTKMFKFEASDKNLAPSLNANLIIEGVQREARLLGEQPNKWLVYNAMNELLHTKLKKTFEQQKNQDVNIFETILAL